MGLPDVVWGKAVNVDCNNDWAANVKDKLSRIGDQSHSWRIGNPVFTADMISALSGIERENTPTCKAEGGATGAGRAGQRRRSPHVHATEGSVLA